MKDIFISYRRIGGYDTAKHLYDLLIRDGYSVCFDIDSLRSGDFEIQLYKYIDESRDFLLIVDEHAFDRTINKEVNANQDWLRCELAYALKKNKNIIPVFLSGISSFPDGLPDDLVNVKLNNGPEYNRYYFNEFYKTLKSRFLHKPRKRIIRNILLLLLSISILGFTTYYFSIDNDKLISDSPNIKQNSNQQIERQYLPIDTLDISFKMVKVDVSGDNNIDPGNGISTFNIGETEVTQSLWESVMGNNPSKIKGENFPVVNVSWDDCEKFILKLNDLTGRKFRIPTYQEWEYAAKGGNPDNIYSGSNLIADVAWYLENSDTTLHPVKTKKPNAYGLYDMTGNVWEWCDYSYSDIAIISQNYNIELKDGQYKLVRGGSWYSEKESCRLNYIGSFATDKKDTNLGFRLAL